MKDISRKFAEFVIRFRVLFILISLFLSFFFLWVQKDLKIQTNLGDFAPQKHPYILVQKQLNYIFGGLNQISIALVVREGDIFNQSSLNKVQRITNKLYLLDGINAGRIVSLAARKIKRIEATADGFKVERLMPEVPETQQGMERLKKAILKNPMLYGPVVSRDFKSTLIQADFESGVSSRKIFGELSQIIELEKDGNNEIYIAGRPILEGWLNFYLPRMLKIFLLTLVVILFLLFLVFKSRRGVILPMVSALMATVWGLGILALSGYGLDPATILVPFLILALGTSHSIQFIKRYYEEVGIFSERRRASLETLQSLFIPASISLITDGLGFLSLLLIPLVTIKSMAIVAGAGVLSIFFTTVTFIPACLSILPLPKKMEVRREERPNIIDRVLGNIAGVVSRRSGRRIIVGIFLLLALLGIMGTTKIVVGDNESGSAILYPDSPYNVAERIINAKFSGSNPYYVFVEGEEEDSLVSSEVLRDMDSLQQYLKKNVQEIGYAVSLADYIKGFNFTMRGGDPKYLTIPENDRTIAEYLFLYSVSGFPGDFDPVASPNFQYANIKVDLKDHRASTIGKVIDTTKEWIEKERQTKNVKFRYAGGDIGILGAVNEIIAKTLPSTILQVSFLVFLCISLFYSSIMAGFLLLLPLLYSLLLTFGMLGFLKIGLTVETLPVAALGIGLGVDYGIYVVSRLSQELKERSNSFSDALRTSLVTSGKAVFFTGTIMALGVFSWAFSPIRLQARLGILLGSFLLLNMVGALVLLPCLVRMIKPKFIFKKRGSFLHRHV